MSNAFGGTGETMRDNERILKFSPSFFFLLHPPTIWSHTKKIKGEEIEGDSALF